MLFTQGRTGPGRNQTRVEPSSRFCPQFSGKAVMTSMLRTKSLSALGKGLLVAAVVSFLAGPSLVGHADPGDLGVNYSVQANKDTAHQAALTQAVNQPSVDITVDGFINHQVPACSTGAAVAGVTVQVTSGSPAGTSTPSNASGMYSITGLGSGPYTVQPTKPTSAPGSAGIDGGDILLTRREALDLPPDLTACQRVAADLNFDTLVDGADVLGVRRFALGLSTLAGFHTGEWTFTPSTRTYITLVADAHNENYTTIHFGDVNGDSISGPIGQNASTVQPAAPTVVAVTVTLPGGGSAPPTCSASIGTNVTTFSLPLRVSDTNAGGATLFGFQGDFTIDPTKFTFQSPAVSRTGLTSNPALWDVASSVSGGNTLRIIVTSEDFSTPLSGAGDLVLINLNRVSNVVGDATILDWIEGLGTRPRFFDQDFAAQDPQSAPNGCLQVSAAPTAVHLSSFEASGYDNGVHLNWNTGFEAENLGFNIYREVAGKRTLVTPDIIAGSALLTGAATRLEAGQSYGWWDKSPGDQQDARYWLEENDINGSRTMHGPFDVNRTGGQPPRESQAALLSQLGRGEPTTHPLALSYQPRHRDLQDGALSARSVASSAAGPNLASMPAVKMSVKEEGWYRVTQQELAAAGLDGSDDPRRLQLYLDGVEQPMLVTGEKDGGFGAIEFFGTEQDSASTDAHVYWLVNGDRPGKRIVVAAGDASGGGVRSFPYTVERRDRTIYFSSLRNGDAENFFGQVITSNGVDQIVTLSRLDSTSGGSAQVEIALQGGIDLDGATDHQVRVLLNGAELGRMSFDGLSRKVERFAVDPGQLKDGNNVFTLIGGASNRDISLVDYIRVTYPRAYISDQDSLRVTAFGAQTIEGFSNPAIRAFDITDPASVVEVTGTVERRGEQYAVGVTLPGQGTRTLLALTDARIKRPASISANLPSNLRSRKNKAGFVIISRREFFSALQPLKALRERQGLKVALVDINDIYDEFSHGERAPQAVKDFLSFAATTWKKKPRFVLFAGHASLDPKNHLGFGDSDLVPTKLLDTELLETSSDDWFVDPDEDGAPNLAVGRLPFRTADEAAIMVSKIISYESSVASSEALLVADANEDFDFESVSAQLRGLLPSSLKASQINRGRMDPDAAKAELLDAINRGQKIVNYFGHGSVNQWKGDLLTNDDARSLKNGGRLPLFVMMTCLNGYFHDAFLDSLAESLLKAEDGGAVAVWASSGMTGLYEQAAINQHLYAQLFGGGAAKGPRLTLGEAVMRAKSSAKDSDVRRTWILLGDPTMRIK
jgi:peptidase C25-like protein